jgi:hypothetical protein
VICLAAVVLTLPVETILLRAVSTSTAQAARDWAGARSSDELQKAASQIQSLPFEYRREVMRRLPPAARAGVWRGHIVSYAGQHPGLDASTQALLYNAASLATPEAFSNPTDELRTQLGVIAEQAKVLLGSDDADYLFYRLGPKDLKIASGLPASQMLANFVRSTFIVEAAPEDCDCAVSFGCDAPNHCDGAQTCTHITEWPACGWWWNSECDGLCMPGIDG